MAHTPRPYRRSPARARARGEWWRWIRPRPPAHTTGSCPYIRAPMSILPGPGFPAFVSLACFVRCTPSSARCASLLIAPAGCHLVPRAYSSLSGVCRLTIVSRTSSAVTVPSAQAEHCLARKDAQLSRDSGRKNPLRHAPEIKDLPRLPRLTGCGREVVQVGAKNLVLSKSWLVSMIVRNLEAWTFGIREGPNV